MLYYNAFVSSDWIKRGISPSVPMLVCVFFLQDFFFLNIVFADFTLLTGR